jgi:hypothetical protein
MEEFFLCFRKPHTFKKAMQVACSVSDVLLSVLQQIGGQEIYPAHCQPESGAASSDRSQSEGGGTDGHRQGGR